jgi:nitrite reductase/ring-hydroxylating ferredoxin subunit/putative sterol carrier protein
MPNAPVPTTDRFPFTAYPSGWFVVATSAELVAGAITTLHYFGRDLIAFRESSGRARVIDAYCPHLGAHLGHGGTVEGDCVRCPFHGWRFDGEGQCVEVPYADRIPPKASIDAWPTLEQDGLVFVFYAQPGEQPWPLPALDGAGYTAGKMVHWRKLATHPQEVFENTVDITHIGPVHDGRRAQLIGKPNRDGPKLDISLEFDAPGDIVGMPDTLNDVRLDVTLYGLGAVIVQTHVRNADIRARQRLYATPVDETHIDIRGIVHVNETDDPEFTEELADLFYRAYVEDFAKDFPIWENKRYLVRPTLAKGDGPIGVYRRWCTQFYPAAGERAAESDAETGSSSASSEARSRVSSGGRSRVDVEVDPADGYAPLLRKLSGRVAGLVPARVRGAATAILAAASERIPILPGPLAMPQDQDEDEDRFEDHDAAQPRARPAAESAPKPATSGPRVASAQEYYETLPQRFVASAAKGVDAVYQWELGGAEARTFHAVVRDGQIAVHDGPHPRPTAALVMDAGTYVKVVNGDLDGMKAFTSGKGKVKGSVRAAMKMRNLFPGG